MDKVLKRFGEHKKAVHTQGIALEKVATITLCTPISTRLNEQHASAQLLHREMVISSIKFRDYHCMGIMTIPLSADASSY